MSLFRALFLAISVFFLTFGSTNPDENFLVQWYSLMSNPQQECSLDAKSFNGDDNEQLTAAPVFETAKDCSEVEARWDYNFKSKVKVKKSGVFEGKGYISLPKKVKRDFLPEHNDYKFGFRHNKCIKLMSDDVKRIAGNFEGDHVEGHVKVDFHSGGYLIGQTRRSKLVGVVRYFDEANKLQNVTIYGDDGIENVVLNRDNKHKLYRLETRETRQMKRIYYTKDFVDVFNCEREESYLLSGCFLAKNLKVKADQCDIEITGDIGAPRDESELFKWNLEEGEKFYNDDADLYPKCSDEWKTENVVRTIKDWLKSLESTDPFWREGQDDSPPLNPDDEIAFNVSEYQGRFVVSSRSEVNVTTLDQKILTVTTWNDGAIRVKADRESSKSSDWSRLLQFDHKLLKLRGFQIELKDDESPLGLATIARVRNGKLHGNVRRHGRVITNPMTICGNHVFRGISYVGRFEDGIPVGPAWRLVVGEGVIYGEPDGNGKLTGDEIAYVYPDMVTALRGRFENGVMKEAEEVEVVACRCVKGILQLRFSQPSRGQTFAAGIPTKDSYGDQPSVTDPLDNRYIEVRESAVEHEVADEGAFAKVDIPPLTPITLYSGLFFRTDELNKYNDKGIREEFLDKGLADDKWKFTKYHGSVPECGFSITIPWNRASLDQYRAALGHKLNHSFRPNCEYSGVLDSPRFGLVRAFYTNRYIKKGEELFISYGYPVETGPPWYVDLYKKTKEQDGQEGFSEKNWAKYVDMLGDKKDSKNSDDDEPAMPDFVMQ